MLGIILSVLYLHIYMCVYIYINAFVSHNVTSPLLTLAILQRRKWKRLPKVAQPVKDRTIFDPCSPTPWLILIIFILYHCKHVIYHPHPSLPLISFVNKYIAYLLN